MVNITVLETFYDLKAHVERRAGTTFPETEARAAQIETALPGYVTVCTIEEAEAKKSGCGSMIGGGLIVLVTVLGAAWISKRR